MDYSVIVPAHNAADTIERTLRSVMAQEPPPNEIVVGDDASTDGTPDLAEGLGAKVLRLPKGNGSIARNRAAKAATTSLLMFMDADDEWLPGKVSAHLEAWTSDSPSFVLDGAIRVRPSGKGSKVNGNPQRRLLEWQLMVDYRNWTCGSAFSVSADHFWAAGGFNEGLPAMQDVDFWIRCAHAVGPALNLGRALTIYHQTGGSVSKAKRDVGGLLQKLQQSMPFLEPKHLAELRRTLAFQNALNSPMPEALGFFRMTGWPLLDKRLAKYLLLSTLRTVRPPGGAGPA